MKRLGLLRHAKSDWGDMNVRDFDRGLTAKGQRGAALMGAHIQTSGIAWDTIIASPAERVRQTLAASGLTTPVRFEQQAYLADPQTLIALLRQTDEAQDAVLIAGHNPGLQELAIALVAPDAEDARFDAVMRKFPTAAFAVLDLAIETWADLAEGCGRIALFARPRDLDPALGPLG